MRTRALLLASLCALSLSCKNFRTALHYAFGSLDDGIISTPKSAPAKEDARPHFADPALLIKNITYLSSPACQGRYPGSEGSELARAYLKERLSSLGLQVTEEEFNFTYRRKKKGHGTNIIASLPGAVPGAPYLVVSAHYDHLGPHKRREGKYYPGADDDASGVAAVLFLADYFSAHPPQHPIVFALFDAEEEIVKGSSAFARTRHLKEHPEQVGFNLNLDMISRGKDGRMLVITPDKQRELRALIDKLQPQLGFEAVQVSSDKVYRALASDHMVFHSLNIPYLAMGDDAQPDYHKRSDTVEKIDPIYYSSVVDGAVLILQLIDAYIPLTAQSPTTNP